MLSRLERELEREARQLGRNLIRVQGDQDFDDDYDDYDEDDLLDMELSDIVFTPLMRSARVFSLCISVFDYLSCSIEIQIYFLDECRLVLDLLSSGGRDSICHACYFTPLAKTHDPEYNSLEVKKHVCA